MDAQINKSIQKREIEKMKTSFYSQLKAHYSTRKYRE